MSAEPDLRPTAGDGLTGDGLNARARRKSWPRKNTPEQIQERQELLRAQPHWSAEHDFVFDWPVPPRELAGGAGVADGAHGPAVSVVGPLRLTLGSYHVDEVDGRLVEDARRTEEVYVPLAHSEGGLSASMQRGIAAVLDGGTLETFVLRDRMTRNSCFVFETTAQAVRCAAWLAAHAAELRDWLHEPNNPLYAERVGGVTRLVVTRGCGRWTPTYSGRPATCCIATRPAKRVVRHDYPQLVRAEWPGGVATRGGAGAGAATGAGRSEHGRRQEAELAVFHRGWAR